MGFHSSGLGLLLKSHDSNYFVIFMNVSRQKGYISRQKGNNMFREKCPFIYFCNTCIGSIAHVVHDDKDEIYIIMI